MRGSVAEMWHGADSPGRLAMLANVSRIDCPVSTVLLGEDVCVLDAVAKEAGLVGIYVATVDATGLSEQSPAVVSPLYAPRYRSRKLKVVEK